MPIAFQCSLQEYDCVVHVQEYVYSLQVELHTLQLMHRYLGYSISAFCTETSVQGFTDYSV